MKRNVASVMEDVKDVLTPDLEFKEVARRLAKQDTRTLPVVDEAGQIVGVISEADLILRDESLGAPAFAAGPLSRSLRRKIDGHTANELMTSPPITVTPVTPITEAARVMRRRRIKVLPVCDDRGRLVGTLSRTDLLLEFVRDDEDVSNDVCQLVYHDLGFPKDIVRVLIDDGVVTLEGTLEHRAQATELARRVWRVPGVVQVIDRLRWTDSDFVLAQGPIPWVG